MTRIYRFLFICCSLATAATTSADDDGLAEIHSFDSSTWAGEWRVENTNFVVRVEPQGNRFVVHPVQPLDMGWNSSNGIINGNSGTINVEYQGVSALAIVRLLSPATAMISALSCQPDYHVVCTLISNQQALFVKE